jgi:hypothetical protein
MYEENMKDSFNIVKGKNPILLSAPHVYPHIRPNFEDTPKKNELYTKEITQTIAKKLDVSAIYTTSKQHSDPNWYIESPYRKGIFELIEENDIKIFIDIHGLNIDNTQDIIIFVNNIDTNGHQIAEQLKKELMKYFKEVLIKEFINNEQFTISEHIFDKYGVPSFQVELNLRVRRDKDNWEKLVSSFSNVFNI